MTNDNLHCPYRTDVSRLSRVTLLLIGGFALAPTVMAEPIMIARYSTIDPKPTEAQRDPLHATVTLSFPKGIKTVGQALQAALRDSGYRLAPSAAADPAREAVLALPLPTVHRELGPMVLRSVLTTLVGPAYRLVEDPWHRLVSFERCVPSGSSVDHRHLVAEGN
jgi:type IV pili sensor histidine kinase/response regulator